ncbi:MAG TPA: ParA family protein [Herpetosiphonaceae bacterium]
MQVIAIANEKGGVGKTTTTVNLAAALGLTGHRVLVIDLDSQGHASEWLGVTKARVPADRSSYAVLSNQAEIPETLLRTGEQNVVLCAAHALLAKAALELGSNVEGLFVLKDALRIDLPVDYVLIDCPPAKGAVVFNALIAADLVVAPVLSQALSLEGLGELNETVGRVQSRYSPHLPAPLIMINDYEGRSAADRQIQEYLRAQFGTQVFRTTIGRDAPLRECFAAKESIFRYRKTARSAGQFRELVDELKGRLGE